MIALRNLHELDIHSGVKSSKITSAIPFYGTTEHHDLHHSRNKGNYASTFTFWDKIFGTYKAEPYRGHQEMEVGLEWQNDKPTKFWWSLWLPFINR